MSKKNKHPKREQDWREGLSEVKKEIVENLSEEEKEAHRRNKAQAAEKRRKLEEIKPILYHFLAGYKHNSAIFVNNFLRHTDFEQYVEDKFYDFNLDLDFDIETILPNAFDDLEYYMHMVQCLSSLEEHKIAYFPIDFTYIQKIAAFALALDYSPRIERPTILYRGCSTIERNAMKGIVSTTTSYEMARQFSRGTILKIHVPKGTKALDLGKVKPRNQRKKDFEDEILLPPCEYTVISEMTIRNNREPNNHFPTTTILEIEVKPLDLLDEFLKAMEYPPNDYSTSMHSYFGDTGEVYEDAYFLLRTIIEKRAKENLFL